MRKIINGKMYDTNKATEVGNFYSPGGWSDSAHYEESLYRKRTGEFFLFGEGGAMTKYAVSEGQNTWSGGSKIIPLSYESARKWAEENLSAKKYDGIFGEVAEDESRTHMCISISASAAETIRRKAQEAGVSVSAYIESLV